MLRPCVGYALGARTVLLDQYAAVSAKLAAIKQAMRANGTWQAQPLEAEQYEFHQAFGADTMTFSQWLQFVLVPRVELVLSSRSTFPSNSSVGTKAIREFDGDPRSDSLVTLLCEFDQLFG
jgi:uncharacterized protein YqcC (DUF446 family)